jgi:hypothetical protein
MRTHPSCRRLLAAMAVAATLVAGCGKSTSTTSPLTTLDQTDADDLALQAAATLDLVGPEIESAVTTGMGGTAPAGANAVSAVQSDTTFTRGGITIHASRTFYGALGAVLPGYSPLAVRLVWTSTASGSHTTLRDTLTVGHDAMIDVRGIQAGQDTLRFTGYAHDTLTNRFRSFDGTRTRYFHGVSSLTYADIAMLKTATYPLSGTMTLEIQGDRLRSNAIDDIEKHFHVVVIITFNGTNQPEVSVNGAYHYRLNLDTGLIVRA